MTKENRSQADWPQEEIACLSEQEVETVSGGVQENDGLSLSGGSIVVCPYCNKWENVTKIGADYYCTACKKKVSKA